MKAASARASARRHVEKRESEREPSTALPIVKSRSDTMAIQSSARVIVRDENAKGVSPSVVYVMVLRATADLSAMKGRSLTIAQRSWQNRQPKAGSVTPCQSPQGAARSAGEVEVKGKLRR